MARRHDPLRAGADPLLDKLTAMYNPLTDDERETIIGHINAGMTRNRIAEVIGRSPSTITRVAQSIGHDFLPGVDARTQSTLTRAHEARSAYCAERRAEIAANATMRVEELLATFMAQRPTLVAGKGGAEIVEVSPDARAIRDLASAVNTLTRTVLDIDRHDNRADGGMAAVDQWLRDIIGG